MKLSFSNAKINPMTKVILVTTPPCFPGSPSNPRSAWKQKQRGSSNKTTQELKCKYTTERTISKLKVLFFFNLQAFHSFLLFPELHSFRDDPAIEMTTGCWCWCCCWCLYKDVDVELSTKTQKNWVDEVISARKWLTVGPWDPCEPGLPCAPYKVQNHYANHRNQSIASME